MARLLLQASSTRMPLGESPNRESSECRNNGTLPTVTKVMKYHPGPQ